MDPVEWLLARFNVTDEQTNYFEAGLVDSLGVITLILDIEQEFNIRFDARHFQDRRFGTIEGLAEIIAEVRDGTL